MKCKTRQILIEAAKECAGAMIMLVIILAGAIVLSEPSTNNNFISSSEQQLESKEVITVERAGND